MFTNAQYSLYINDEYLAIAAVNTEALSGQVRAAIVRDLPAGVVERGWPKQPEALKKEIEAALSEAKPPLKPADLIVVLPDVAVYTRVMATPNIAKEDIDKYVKNEIAHTIPIPAHEVKLSYRPIQSPAGKRIVVAAVERQLLAAWQELFARLKINVAWFDVEMLALRRGLEAGTAGQMPAILDMGYHNSTLAVYDEAGLVFSFYLPFGENYLVRRIARESNLPPTEVKASIQKAGLDTPDHHIGALLQEHMQLIVAELIKNLDYYERGRKNKVNRIILTGRLGHLPGCKQYLALSELGERLHINELGLKLADDVYKAEGAVERAVTKRYAESDPIFTPSVEKYSLSKLHISRSMEYLLVVAGLVVILIVAWWLWPQRQSVVYVYPEANPNFIATRQVANLRVNLSLSESGGYFPVRVESFRAMAARPWPQIEAEAKKQIRAGLASGEEIYPLQPEQPEQVLFPYELKYLVYRPARLEKYLFERLYDNTGSDLVLLDYEIEGLEEGSVWLVTVAFSANRDFDPALETELPAKTLIIQTAVPATSTPTRPVEEVLAEARAQIQKDRVRIDETGLGWLNARQGPGLNFEIVAKLSPGDEFELLSTTGEWYEIAYRPGTSVWISAKYAIIISN